MTRVLLVEDDKNLCFILKSSLEQMIGGYEVETAANGEEGLKRLAEGKFDVIVSDVEMPVMDGMTMVRHIREHHPQVAIIFITGLTTARDVINGYQSGADFYIKKPFLPEELDAHIQAVLKVKQSAVAPEREESSSVCLMILMSLSCRTAMFRTMSVEMSVGSLWPPVMMRTVLEMPSYHLHLQVVHFLYLSRIQELAVFFIIFDPQVQKFLLTVKPLAHGLVYFLVGQPVGRAFRAAFFQRTESAFRSGADSVHFPEITAIGVNELFTCAVIQRQFVCDAPGFGFNEMFRIHFLFRSRSGLCGSIET